MAADMREKLVSLGKRVIKLKDKDEKSWAQIAEELEVSAGKAMLAYDFASVGEDEIVTARNDEEMGKKIVRMRDHDLLSWGKIMAKTNLGEQRCRTLYEQSSGTTTLGNRIGKGGRQPGGASPAPRKAAGAKKAPAKKAPGVKKVVAKKAPTAKKAVAKKAGGTKKAVAKKATAGKADGGAATSGKTSPLEEMDFDELVERLEGRKIGVRVGDTERTSTIHVKSVKALNENGVLDLLDTDMKHRSVRVTDILRASK